MELNEDEDFGSPSTKKDRKESGIFGMWVKLKMPKQHDDLCEDQKLGFGKKMKKYMGMKRVCEICGKEFKSGKALGGHMSSHVQIARDKTFIFNRQKPNQHLVEKKKYSCAICGKKFWSMKALSGHMRCHPDRSWRGINPPPEKDMTVVDLMESLTGWPVTAKRGRRPIPAEEDRVSEAVSFLMMMARGESKVIEIDVESNDDGHYKSCGSKLKVMMNKRKRRKKVKLCDLNLMDNGNKLRPEFGSNNNVDVFLHQETMAKHNQKGASFQTSLTETGHGKLLNLDLNELPSG